MESNFRYKVRKKHGYETISGFVTIDENFFVFEPENKEIMREKIAMYRIVQTGFRKVFQFIPFKFYFKTSSGSVFYYLSPKSKEIIKNLDSFVY